MPRVTRFYFKLRDRFYARTDPMSYWVSNQTATHGGYTPGLHPGVDRRPGLRALLLLGSLWRRHAKDESAPSGDDLGWAATAA